MARLWQDGFIKDTGIHNSLAKKLDAALADQERGQTTAAKNVLGAFQNQVNAQAGKAIDDWAVHLLLKDSTYVIQTLG